MFRRTHIVYRTGNKLFFGKSPDFLQEAENTDQPLRVPRLGHIERPHKHLIHTARIGAVLSDHLIRIDDIF